VVVGGTILLPFIVLVLLPVIVDLFGRSRQELREASTAFAGDD